MNQDARNKLRGMGGIMASSPKLMQVAQGYQISGPVMPPPRMPMSDSLTVPGIGAPVLGLGRVPPMPPQMPTAGVGSLGEEAGVTVDDLLEGSGATAFSLPETAGPAVSGPSPSDIIKRQNDLRRRRGLPPLSPGAEQEFLKSAAEAPLPQDVAAAEAAQAELAAIEERKVGGVPASSADAERERQLREEIGETGRRMGETLEAEDVAMSMPLQPKRLTQEQIDKATELARKDPNFVFPGTQEEPAPDTDTETGGPSGGGTGGPAPTPTKRDLRSRYKEKIELFKEIYGEDDEDRARDKAMSLAMLGLAIAAGQSPNALTNIAQGAMVGLQGMSEQEQARREREQGLKTLALETAINEQAAGAEAEAEAARLDAERKNKLDVARIRAAGDAAGGSGFNKNETPADVFMTTFNTASGAGQNFETSIDQADKLARAQLELIRPVITEERYLEELAALERVRVLLGGLSPEQQATVAAAKQAVQSGQTSKEKAQKALAGVGIDPSVLD